MSNHIHIVVTAKEHEPNQVIKSLKSYGTRALRQSGKLLGRSRIWTKGGNSRYLNDRPAVDAAVGYVLKH